MAAGASPILAWHHPPLDLAPFVLGFVHRDERVDGGVVRVLPEVRAAIQVMAGDPYWLRSRASDAPWRRLPQIALWGPQYEWGYGFAAAHVTAFAVGLTGVGLRYLLGAGVADTVSRFMPLADTAPGLADALAPGSRDFEAWREQALTSLRAVFTGAAADDPIAPTLDILATAEESAVAAAAAASGLSERQYRRVFRDLHGVSPKRYQRAVRVDRMLRQLHARPWEADDHRALPIPFADQPHAIREFRAMTGLTPLQYARAKLNGDATLRSVPAPGVPKPTLA